ncbi:MAG: hypothetical protein A3H49_01945 [Nitrospirae bacterium RIFCSPLOWO2_02_FULL_62_14]|nr:MAG: hypothetical protein A3H49_01945 [Nitrospirae bacterium RIFCSPLOWO2_02_FULL_62_14]
MKSVQDIIATIERAFREDPRPCCLRCLDVTSQELCEQVEKHIKEKLSNVYTVEDGTCQKKDHHARVIRPKSAGAAMPNYKDRG